MITAEKALLIACEFLAERTLQEARERAAFIRENPIEMDDESLQILREQWFKRGPVDPEWMPKEHEFVLAREPREFPFGWVFRYDTRGHLATKRYVELLLSPTDFIVDREDGSVYETRTGGCIPIPGKPPYGSKKFYQLEYEELRAEKAERERSAAPPDAETDP